MRRGGRTPDGAGGYRRRRPATIETYSVRYDWPVRTGIIMGRLDSDDSRFLATSEDEDLVGLMSDGDPLGAPIVVRATDCGNRASFA